MLYHTRILLWLLWICRESSEISSSKEPDFAAPYVVLTGINSNLTFRTFENYINITSIGIYRSKINHVDPATFLKTQFLDILEMGHNERLPALTTKVFHYLDNLRTLRLFGNQHLFLGPRAFFYLKNLKTFHLINQTIKEPPYNLFEDCNKLTELSLAHNEIESLQPNTFAPLYNLEILILSRNKLIEIGTGTFANLTKLKELHIDSNKLHSIIWYDLSYLVNLQYLKIDHNKIKRLNGKNLQNIFPMLKVINFLPNDLSCRDEETFISQLELYGISNEFMSDGDQSSVSACGSFIPTYVLVK